MAEYVISLAVAAVGLATFLMNCDPNFDQGFFWRPNLGKQHARECFNDERRREKGIATKDDEIWLWVGSIHPIYFPFETVTTWICDTLVGKYEDKSVTRPDWMNTENKDEFIKRIVTIYMCKGENEEEIDEALVKLFGWSIADFETGVEGQLTFIKSKKSK
ncbi:hypothetical protein TL16_g02718 [Triparma laevis f. inornata]|uniref:Uncharacterized protein n=2 Tax=Triparma laevis TaxID=1534972 RepID=A0A9W7A1G3_9STRA|nr:hypothetical protein TL16_g02718 [Triparma laevis f. inornata]GMH60938.1 hypothetical protein TrLO_g13648 [Triparma laevis f. longispina]